MNDGDLARIIHRMRAGSAASEVGAGPVYVLPTWWLAPRSNGHLAHHRLTGPVLLTAPGAVTCTTDCFGTNRAFELVADPAAVSPSDPSVLGEARIGPSPHSPDALRRDGELARWELAEFIDKLARHRVAAHTAATVASLAAVSHLSPVGTPRVLHDALDTEAIGEVATSMVFGTSSTTSLVESLTERVTSFEFTNVEPRLWLERAVNDKARQAVRTWLADPADGAAIRAALARGEKVQRPDYLIRRALEVDIAKALADGALPEAST